MEYLLKYEVLFTSDGKELFVIFRYRTRTWTSPSVENLTSDKLFGFIDRAKSIINQLIDE